MFLLSKNYPIKVSNAAVLHNLEQIFLIGRFIKELITTHIRSRKTYIKIIILT